jgi:hypothetical protein
MRQEENIMHIRRIVTEPDVHHVPLDAVMISPSVDPAAARGEYMQVLPGLAERTIPK